MEHMSSTTTDLDRLRKGARYTWGRVIRIHEIGPYAIVESADRVDGTRGAASGFKTYHAYVDGQNTHHGYPSLDTALAGAIAYRAEGANGQAAAYFAKMLGLPDNQERVQEGE